MRVPPDVVSMNRRDFTLSAGSIVATAALGGPDVSANESAPTISRAARALHRRAIVLDANLAPHLLRTTSPLPDGTMRKCRTGAPRAVRQVWLDGDEADDRRLQRPVRGHSSGDRCRPEIDRRSRRPVHTDSEAPTISKPPSARESSASSVRSKASRCWARTSIAIDTFAQRGVRVMQLSYNRASPFGRAFWPIRRPASRNSAARRRAHERTRRRRRSQSRQCRHRR